MPLSFCVHHKLILLVHESRAYSCLPDPFLPFCPASTSEGNTALSPFPHNIHNTPTIFHMLDGVFSIEFPETQEEGDCRCCELVRGVIHIYFVNQFALFPLACSLTRGLFFSGSGLFLSPVYLFKHKCIAPSPCEHCSNTCSVSA